jgi:hypothetical protein
MADPLSCKETTWLVSEARERALSSEERQNLAEHIATCTFCQGASRQFEVLFKEIDNYLGNSRSEKAAQK